MQPLPAPAHALPAADVVVALQSDGTWGLSEAEAKLRLHTLSTNTLTNRGGKPGWLKFLLQFNNPLLITLLLVGAVKALLGHPSDALVIWSVTVINAVIGFVQESKAENAIAALAQSVRTEVEVVRSGARQRLVSEQLVPGDLVQLEAGTRVPADLRLLEGRQLQTDESAITGEAMPVHKGTTAVEASAPLAERIGMAYAGSFVTKGQGMGLVVATGDDTEVGCISTSLQDQVDLTTPLTRKFGRFSRSLLKLILVLAGLTFLVGLARGRGVEEMFDGAVALAVGAIPEELPAIVTITLAIGVNRMAKRRAIIRKLPAVETLGSTTVICSDKTGTLTQNRMTVQHLYGGSQTMTIEDLWPNSGRAGSTNVALQETLLAGLLCNDARPSRREGLVGDPTETALLVAADAAGIDRQDALERHPRRDAIELLPNSNSWPRCTAASESWSRARWKPSWIAAAGSWIPWAIPKPSTERLSKRPWGRWRPVGNGCWPLPLARPRPPSTSWSTTMWQRISISSVCRGCWIHRAPRRSRPWRPARRQASP